MPAIVDCGWGRLLSARPSPTGHLAAAIRRSARSSATWRCTLRDPHVVVALAPQQLFLDPSHTYRKAAACVARHRSRSREARLDRAARSARPDDATAINRILPRTQDGAREAGALASLSEPAADPRRGLVAQDRQRRRQGVVTGVDHVRACADPDGGSSLWSLAVDPQCLRHGVGMS
jgi:ribosomal protein S18 acetylase RimI-like enzyme